MHVFQIYVFFLHTLYNQLDNYEGNNTNTLEPKKQTYFFILIYTLKKYVHIFTSETNGSTETPPSLFIFFFFFSVQVRLDPQKLALSFHGYSY